jgi:Spy/CpxP family protein refolding chaperone
MQKTRLFLLAILSFFILIGSTLYAQEKKILKFKKEGPVTWEMKSKLNLTDEQKKKFDDLEFQHEKKMIDLRADLEKSKLSKRELINKGNISSSEYLAAEEKIMQAENKIQMEKAKLKMDKYDLLDENQKKNFFSECENEFIFNFDMSEFNDKMKIFNEKMHHFIPCPPDVDDIEKEIEVEIEGDEI